MEMFTSLRFVLLLSAGGIASLILIYLLRKDPAHWGLEKSLKKFYWLPGFAPLVLVGAVLLQTEVEDMSFPTNLAVHQDVVVLHGQVETVRERVIDQVPESFFYPKTYFLDRHTGEELYRISAIEPYYATGGKLLCAVDAGYGIVDLKTGKIEKKFTEAQLRKRLEALGQQVYALTIGAGSGAFTVRSVLDETLLYDPITNQVGTSESDILTTEGMASFPDYKTTTPDIFQPKLVGQTMSGISIVLSYPDLNQEYFILHGFDAQGNKLWTKSAREIDEALDGEHFAYDYQTTTTATDADYFYFANKHRVVCLYVATGVTRWVSKI